jgi:histidyl-tRNA synthetase
METKRKPNDLTIQEVHSFRCIENAFMKRCHQFGYQEIKTGTIQPLHIYTAQGTFSPSRLRRMYSFIDWDGWSGERVVLKPDSSPSVVRFYAENLYTRQEHQKLCYVENHFEWSDSGENISERWQCGIENIGDSSVTSDIETIFIAQDILEDMGFHDRHVFLSYPEIVRHIVHSLVFSKEQQQIVLNDIKKQRFNQVKAMLSGVDQSSLLIRLLETKGNSASYLKNIIESIKGPDFEAIDDDMQRLITICEHLDQMECPYTIDFSLLGNLDYYTGMRFQIFSTASRKTNADILCAGGRYGQLAAEMFKLLGISTDKGLPEKIPAVGFAMYAKNIIRHMMTSDHDLTSDSPHIVIYLSHLAPNSLKMGQVLSDVLRDMGFHSTVTFSAIDQDDFSKYGAVIEVNHERFQSGYQFLHEKAINKYTLNYILGDINE